jgi:hypothetical protein
MLLPLAAVAGKLVMAAQAEPEEAMPQEAQEAQEEQVAPAL